MKLRHHGWRVIVGMVLAGLIGVGLLPAPAHAAEGPNLALGKSARAGGSHGNYPAGNVTDGSQASYWEGPAGALPQWVQVDLGANAEISRVALKLPSTWEARNQTLSVSGSTDGSSFAPLSASGARAFDPAGANTVSIPVTATTVRYVRVQVSANSGWNAAQLSELEVYGEDDGPGEPPVTGSNLARNKPIEASSFTQTYVASNANDDSPATYWESTAIPRR